MFGAFKKNTIPVSDVFLKDASSPFFPILLLFLILGAEPKSKIKSGSSHLSLFLMMHVHIASAFVVLQFCGTREIRNWQKEI